MKELTEIREELLDQHTSLKTLAMTIREMAAGQEEAEGHDRLIELISQFADEIDAHNTREEYLLGEVLPTIDAWGSERLARMDEHHVREHREIADRIRAATASGDRAVAVGTALTTIDDLMAHMRQEEKEFLAEDVLRDDVINIQQTDG